MTAGCPDALPRAKSVGPASSNPPTTTNPANNFSETKCLLMEPPLYLGLNFSLCFHLQLIRLSDMHSLSPFRPRRPAKRACLHMGLENHPMLHGPRTTASASP